PCQVAVAESRQIERPICGKGQIGALVIELCPKLYAAEQLSIRREAGNENVLVPRQWTGKIASDQTGDVEVAIGRDGNCLSLVPTSAAELLHPLLVAFGVIGSQKGIEITLRLGQRAAHDATNVDGPALVHCQPQPFILAPRAK